MDAKSGMPLVEPEPDTEGESRGAIAGASWQVSVCWSRPRSCPARVAGAGHVGSESDERFAGAPLLVPPKAAHPAVLSEWMLYDYLMRARGLSCAGDRFEPTPEDFPEKTALLPCCRNCCRRLHSKRPLRSPETTRPSRRRSWRRWPATIRRWAGRPWTSRCRRSIAADGRPAAAEAALRFLAGHPGPERDELLLPACWRAAGRRGVRSKRSSPRRTCESRPELVKTSGSSSLRAEVAKVIVESSTPADVRAFLEPVVKGPLPVNLEAMTIIYRSSWLDAASRSAEEKFFRQCSSEALENALGTGTRPPAAGVDGDWPCQAARCLWSPDFTGYLELRHREVELFAEGVSVVVLNARCR